MPNQSRLTGRPASLALWLCVGSVVTSLALRGLYLAQPWRIDMSVHPAHLATEGIVGLMARHVLAGARPLFFYGQYYLGALEAYLVAGLFRVFGESMATVRAVPMVFAVATIPLAGAIGALAYGRSAGLLAATLVALPSPFVFEWGLKAWGGHVEHPTMMLLALYLLMLLVERVNAARVTLLGFVLGFALWINQLAGAYLPLCAYALLAWIKLRRKEMLLLLVAGFVGVSPLLYGNVRVPLGTLRSAAFQVRASWRRGAHTSPQTDQSETKFYRAIPLLQILGAQPRRDGMVTVSGTLAALFLTAGTVASAWGAFRARRRDLLLFRRRLLVLGFAGMTVPLGIAGFFGQQVGRYQLVLYPLLAVLAVGWLEAVAQRWATAVVAALALAQAIQIAAPVPSDGRTSSQLVIGALEQRGLHYGYGADYMYDLVFESRERVIIEPVVHSKYPPYQSKLAAADRLFYLYRDDQQEKPTHQVFMKYLAEAGIRYQRLDIREYHVLYDFEPAGSVSPQAIAKIREEIRSRKGRRVVETST